MNVFVTGATGFLGRHLLPLLLARGDDVRALVRAQTDDGELRKQGVEVIRGALLDRDAIRTGAAGCELVFNVAGVVAYEKRDLPRLEAANVRGVEIVLAAVDPDARVVHVSSVAALGPNPGPSCPGDESQPYPEWAENLDYARTKRDGERIALALAQSGRDVVVASPGYLLGPGDRYGASAWLVPSYLAGRLPTTTAGGQSYTDVRDVAPALLGLADRGRAGERTILASREGNLSYPDFFARVASVTGVRRRQVYVPPALARAAARVVPWPLGPGQVGHAVHWWHYDPGKAEGELAYTTRPLDETIADTAAEYL